MCMSREQLTGTILIALYVDDTLLGGDNLEMIEAIKKWLSYVFGIKDMSKVRYVLGMKMVRNCSKNLLGLCQEAYIKKLLECF